MKTQNPPLRPGVSFTPDGTRFVVCSEHAVAVDVCLYAPLAPEREVARARMQRAENHLWHVVMPQAAPGMLYGFRAHGEWQPDRGRRFDGRKLLLDPYARAIFGNPDSAPHMLAGPRSRDNGREALKSVVVDESYDWRGDSHLCIPWRDSVIYELHVKGFTKTHPGLPEELRGTYAGLSHPEVIEYLLSLGVTAVQLLPVHAHLDDLFLLERGLTNYWGYNTLGFFAPHGEYASVDDPQAQVREFKDMVRSLHAAGIEVILDVVYNHTAEAGVEGPMLMLRGLDDSAYYRQTADHNYVNVTGCGNSVDSASALGLRLILDSLRYWVTEMHVDGFRFDLAVTVARDEHDAFSSFAPFLAAVEQDPVLSRVKLIAEPWDISQADSYQVGGFPAPWRELNGKFRDTARCYWRGDAGMTAEFAKRFCGSEDIYGPLARPPLASVNFITSHDGFTLRDLVSYAKKHNEANGEANRDGDEHNFSQNRGEEGPTNDEAILEQRSRAARALMATLALATGVPMLCAGDERGRTQQGNNNAYCQDNAISWLDWSTCDEVMLRFVRRVLALRRERAALRRVAFFDGKIDPLTGLRDVTWLEGDGTWLCSEEWHDPARQHFGALIAGVSGEAPLLLLFNNDTAACQFHLPGDSVTIWQLLFDTAQPDSHTRHAGVELYAMCGMSMACLELAAGSALDADDV
ncbi:MAG: glycogen debranching protein GlgX [Verrucomicrobiaceae bacterium]|nr:glycogen debranching protein GlgX [Verrucomicrobiaceae bacterium]